MTFSQARTAAIKAAAAVLAGASRNEAAAAALLNDAGAASQKGAASIGMTRQGAQMAAQRVVARTEQRAAAALAVLTAGVRKRLPAVATRTQLAAELAGVFDTSGRAAGLVRSIVVRRQRRRMYLGLSMSADGIEALARLRTHKAEALARGRSVITRWDELVEIAAIGSSERAEAVAALCGIARWGRWAILRRGIAGRVEAALHEIGEPAAADRIGEVAGCSAEGIQQQAGGWAWIRRSGNNRWGLAAWGHAEYRNCIEAMTQMVRGAGGRIRRTTLITRITTACAVRPSTADNCLRRGPFRITGGWVEEARIDVQTLGPLAERVDGFDADGRPFVMIEAYDDRLWRGYSATNVPYELAAHAGCKPGGRIDLHVVDPAGCGPLSCIWSSTSTSKVSIGRLARACRRIGVRVGDHVRVAVDSDGRAWIKRVREGTWCKDQSLRTAGPHGRRRKRAATRTA